MGRTGYVHTAIEKDVDFKGFALICARAFGACVTMRDDSLDVEIPEEFEASDFYLKEEVKAKAKYELVSSMSDEEYEEYAKKEYQEKIARYNEYLTNDQNGNKKVFELLKQANSYHAPDGLENFKSFMVEQLNNSIETVDYWAKEIENAKPIEKEAILKSLQKDMVRYREEYIKEVNRVQERNNWLNKLRTSLETL